MGVPTSKVGYTPAMLRREDHEVHKGHVVALGGGGIIRLNPPPVLWELTYRQTVTDTNSTSYNRTAFKASQITFHGRWTGLWTRYWIFGFHKMRKISWLAEELLSSQKWLYAPRSWVSNSVLEQHQGAESCWRSSTTTITKYCTWYEIRKTAAHHWLLHWTTSIQYTTEYPVRYTSVLSHHPRLGLRSGLFPWGSSISLIFSICDSRIAQVFFLDFIIPWIPGV